MALPKPLELVQVFLKQAVRSGDRVVDATLGNGYDCAFLADLVGPSGKVIGFDVQQQAIDRTRERLADRADRSELILAGHESIAEYVEPGVSAIVYNLGYLPGADKDKTTSADTTLRALSASTGLLKNGGLLSIMCYVGHPGGMEEGCAVKDWAAELPRTEWRVFQYTAVNAPNNPPFLIIIEKL